MVKFDPDNELSDKELELLGESNFDDFLDYLDQKSKHLKTLTRPLSSYMSKRYSSISTMSQGKELSNEQIKKAGDIGKQNDKEEFDKIRERFEEMEKNDPKYKDEGIKNIKTHRSQWFD